MMPIKYILEHAQKMRVIDIEEIGGLLEYHNRIIVVSNDFTSDSGDNWMCGLYDKDRNKADINHYATSLRKAVLDALEKLENL